MSRRRVGVIVGGCAYRLMIRTETAGSLAAFVGVAALDAMNHERVLSITKNGSMVEGSFAPAFDVLAVDFQHTSNLPQGRCNWLARAVIRTSLLADALAVSIDTDTEFEAGGLLADLPLMLADDVAIGCVPIRVGGTQLCNLNITKEHETRGPRVDRVSMDELKQVLLGSRDIESGGFGLAVFNLSWFRKHWPKPEPEGIGLYVGEDIAMCRSVRQRGGRVIALRVEASHHEFRP